MDTVTPFLKEAEVTAHYLLPQLRVDSPGVKWALIALKRRPDGDGM